jgi:hypothetical protein
LRDLTTGSIGGHLIRMAPPYGGDDLSDRLPLVDLTSSRTSARPRWRVSLPPAIS